MTLIEKTVAAARWRLLVRQWAERLGRCLTVAFCLALIAILAPKLFAIPDLPAWWSAAWLIGAVVVGLVGATGWSILQPRSELDAAVEIDKRFDLRERIASSLSLDEATLETEAGLALARDAERAAERVEVSEHFRLGLDRGVWRPLLPAALALLLAGLVGNREAEATVEKPPTEQVTAKEKKEAAETARKKLAKKREEAVEEGLKDASALLKKVEEGTGELAKKTPKDVTKAAVKLNDLTKQLAERRQKLGGGEQLRKQMNRMKDLGRGPAEKAADAMKKGDWQKAMNEVNKLKQQMAGGKLSKEKQKQLAAQLGKMSQKLSQAAKQQAAQQKELQRQLAEAQRKGDTKQANKLQQKLDQLAMKAPQMQKLQQMAQQMNQAQQALNKGDAQQAQKAMAQMAKQMNQMQKEAQEMEMLDAAMTDIQMAKQGMGCQACEGGQMAGMGMGKGKGKKKPGQGMGKGQGKGARPSEENDVAYRDTKVKQNVGKGASTFGGLVKGPSVKGQVVESIKTQLSAETVQPADPLTSERLPRSRREHAKEYFKSLNEKL